MYSSLRLKKRYVIVAINDWVRWKRLNEVLLWFFGVEVFGELFVKVVKRVGDVVIVRVNRRWAKRVAGVMVLFKEELGVAEVVGISGSVKKAVGKVKEWTERR
jgi:RNase P/RNase MRP subunit POP5